MSMSRRDKIVQVLFILFFLVLGAGVFITAIGSWSAGELALLGAIKVVFLGLGMLLLGIVGMRGLCLSEGIHRPSYLARAYYHSTFGRYASIAAGVCLWGWIAIRVFEAL